MVAATVGRKLALRERAVSYLNGNLETQDPLSSGMKALGVIHDLASSPETAADALALLHELQVHQLELSLQAEEDRAALAALEAALDRQSQRIDGTPVGCYTLDAQGVVCEANLAGARALGIEREALPGHRLDVFLAPAARPALQSMLSGVAADGVERARMLSTQAADGVQYRVRLAVAADPAGPGFLVALTDMGERVS